MVSWMNGHGGGGESEVERRCPKLFVCSASWYRWGLTLAPSLLSWFCTLCRKASCWSLSYCKCVEHCRSRESFIFWNVVAPEEVQLGSLGSVGDVFVGRVWVHALAKYKKSLCSDIYSKSKHSMLNAWRSVEDEESMKNTWLGGTGVLIIFHLLRFLWMVWRGQSRGLWGGCLAIAWSNQSHLFG